MNKKNYYQKQLFILAVDKNDNPIKKVERWQAHKEGILHRGFTTILKYQNNFILQHRKHPVFDGVFDLSFSSHPIFIDEKLQTFEEAIFETFKREWVSKEEKIEIKFLNKYYYKEKDEKSGYFEHEINYLYLIDLKKPIKNNPLYSYGMKVLTKEDLINQFEKINFGPWVKKEEFIFFIKNV
jgi:isopentenyldiphosphate isomerase